MPCGDSISTPAATSSTCTSATCAASSTSRVIRRPSRRCAGPDTVSRRSRVTMSARVAFAVTLVLAVGVLALSFAAYWRVSASLAVDLDRSLLREAEAFSGAISPGVAAGTDLRAATRTYLAARSQASGTSRPVLLVHFASGTPSIISNSDLLLEDATGNAAALDVATAKAAFIDLTLGAESYRATTVPVRSSEG